MNVNPAPDDYNSLSDMDYVFQEPTDQCKIDMDIKQDPDDECSYSTDVSSVFPMPNVYTINMSTKQIPDCREVKSICQKSSVCNINMDLKQESGDDCDSLTIMNSVPQEPNVCNLNMDMKQEPCDDRSHLTVNNSVSQETSACDINKDTKQESGDDCHSLRDNICISQEPNPCIKNVKQELANDNDSIVLAGTNFVIAQEPDACDIDMDIKQEPDTDVSLESIACNNTASKKRFVNNTFMRQSKGYGPVVNKTVVRKWHIVKPVSSSADTKKLSKATAINTGVVNSVPLEPNVNACNINMDTKRESGDDCNSSTYVSSVLQDPSTCDSMVPNFKAGLNQCSPEPSKCSSTPSQDVCIGNYLVAVDKPYACAVCEARFCHDVDFRKHLERHNAQNPVTLGDKMIKLDVFQNSSSDDVNLEQHGKTHAGDKPYQCDVCQKSFVDKGRLARHRKHVHTGERPYKCDVCEKSFRLSCHLTAHLRSHTGEKHYRCGVCQKSFSSKSIFNKHIKIHTGEKPYKCDVCQKSFSGKHYLKRHSRTHTGEKPYKCDICQKSFACKGNLKQHDITHASDRAKPYECGYCQKTFAVKCNLQQHTKKHVTREHRRPDVRTRMPSRHQTWTNPKADINMFANVLLPSDNVSDACC